MKAGTSIVVERPIEDVWAFVANIENMDQWVVGVSEPRLSNGRDIGVGATYTSKYTYAGKTHTIDYEVTAYEPQQHFATQSTEGPFPFQGELDLERVGQGTKVTNTIDAGSDGLFTTITFKLLGPLVRISMRRQLHKELVALKNILETG
ncbi:MAG: SRPBCC family protein [Chloroflexota bacterium]|nr:SRPBCC family protein [Chloroflexota bacterium]